MVQRINFNNNKDANIDNLFVEIIKRNIDNRRQSIIFLVNDKITLNSRDISVVFNEDADALLVYNNDDVLKTIIDIGSIIAVVTK